MQYFPLNYEKLNVIAGHYNPSPVKSYNNKTFAYWCRSLFQRASSTLEWELPETWKGSVKDFFLYCLFKYGFVACFETDKNGFVFQPCTLGGYDFFYQPTYAQISNPSYRAKLDIGTECELIKLCPDFFGIWDVIERYAEMLSQLDNAINMSIINNKFAYVLGAKNKSSASALQKIFDKINRGEPTVIYDKAIFVDKKSEEEPFHFLERSNLKQNYLTTDQLIDLRTLLNDFDSEIGIPTLPYQKKERLNSEEVNGQIIDGMSRAVTWFETLTSSIEKVNDLFNQNISVKLRYEPSESEVAVNE